MSLWQLHLDRAGWHTYAPVLTNSDDFLFAIQSPWQRKMMLEHGKTMIFIDATHNTVKNCFLSQGRKISLYTVLIRNPVTGKGLPVCWAFTTSLAI
ncbi:hypothetical protein PtA15_18A115 [Puccinia triticina]|uniref:MULE transposase domain-containing protein n=1 Tax=Puccinia triticina TaxID=208348 RepID=A0ABY7D5X9_9BASI|nr:uncharacterized protein PtA15_18A115 [Puccinia triticina]WAQ93059.1 hypothetical protein PtA15_18A115 [Puccinia triticina]